MRRLLTVLLSILLISVWSAAALALQEITGKIEQEAGQIEKLLRCPVCTGQTVAESNAEKAREIKEEIRRMLAQGKSRQQILDYYATQYGDWILTRPKSAIVWVMPAVIVVVGAAVLFTFLRRAGGRPARAAAEPAPPAAATAGAGGADPAPRAPEASEAGAASELDPKLLEKIQQRLQDFI